MGAYLPFNPNVPNGATQAPDAYAASDLANIRALFFSVVCGFIPGWSFIASGDVYRPAVFQWTSGALAFRVLLVYAGDRIATAAWEFTENGGALWTNINTGGTPAIITSDVSAASLAIQAQDKDAGVITLVLNAIQNANAVAITGGAISAVTLSGSDVVSSRLLNIFRSVPAPMVVLTPGVAWDWGATPIQCQANSAPTIWIANAAQGEVKRLYVFGGPVTFTSPGGVHITLANGTVQTGGQLLVSLVAITATEIYATITNFF